jgi:hypothetical protein
VIAECFSNKEQNVWITHPYLWITRLQMAVIHNLEPKVESYLIKVLPSLKVAGLLGV